MNNRRHSQETEAGRSLTVPPAPERSLPLWLTNALNHVEMTTGVPEIAASAALSSTERSQAMAIVRDLDGVLRPATKQEIAPQMAKIFVAFPGERLPDEEARMRAEVYLIALGGMPAWAIEQAVAWWLMGAEGDGTENYAFAPSPPQLRRLAEKAARAARLQRHRIRELLDAKVYTDPTPEMREKVAAMMARFRVGKPIKA